MFATTLRVPMLKKLCRPMLALGFACALGGFTTAGCVDNSGNKDYPRGDAGLADTAAETTDDTGTTEDAPATDAPATDAPATDTPAIDAPSLDTGIDLSATDTAHADTGADVHADTGTGG
jgi:hypothetical protein